jgi:hypothetical protein
MVSESGVDTPSRAEERDEERAERDALFRRILLGAGALVAPRAVEAALTGCGTSFGLT